MAIPPLVLRIYADSSGVKRGVMQAQGQVNGLRATVSRNAGLIKTALGVAVVAGLVKSVQAAGDLNEAVNAVNVTFKASSSVVRKWAKDAATSAGLAEAEALQAAAGVGAMFDSAGIGAQQAAQMSVTVNQLAADIGSLRNADPTDMLDRMRAGLAGEAEPLRKFGIFLSEARVQQEAVRMGLVEVGEELTDAQKIQARYNIILEDGAEASGDFARTAGGSLPNQLRMLRAQLINVAASLGKVLLPAVTTILSWVNRLLGKMEDWAKIIDKEVGPALSDAATEVKRMSKELGPLLKDLEPVTKLLGGAFLTNLKATALFIRGVSIAIRGLINYLRTLIDVITTAIEKLSELAAKVPGGGGSLIPGGSGLGIIGKLIGFAGGGSIAAGQAAVVGERGPELFIPRVAGTVVPNGAGMGDITIPIYLGDEILERVVVRGLKRSVSH